MDVLSLLKSCTFVGHLEQLTAVISEPSRLISFVILNLKLSIIWSSYSYTELLRIWQTHSQIRAHFKNNITHSKLYTVHFNYLICKKMYLLLNLVFWFSPSLLTLTSGRIYHEFLIFCSTKCLSK